MKHVWVSNGVANIEITRIRDYISKYYCCYCGARLKRVKDFRSFMPGDKGFEVQRIGDSYHRGPYTVTRDSFYCAECNVTFDTTELDYNLRIQKLNKKKIVRTLYDHAQLNEYVETFSALAKEIIEICDSYVGSNDVIAFIRNEFEGMLICLENEHRIPVISAKGEIASSGILEELDDTELAVRISRYAEKCKRVEKIYLSVKKPIGAKDS